MSILLGIVAMAAAEAPDQSLIPAFFTGDRLLEICSEQNAGFCSMYVAGVADGIFHAETGEPPTLCRGSLTNREARKVVTDYLSDHPEARKYAAAVAVELALKPVLRCDEQKPSSHAGSASPR